MIDYIFTLILILKDYQIVSILKQKIFRQMFKQFTQVNNQPLQLIQVEIIECKFLNLNLMNKRLFLSM